MFLIVILHFLILLTTSTTYAVDRTCEAWFDRNIKKIQKDCEPSCAKFSVDMGTFSCPAQCDKLCFTHKIKTSSRPGRVILYPGLTPAERMLVNVFPQEASTVFIAKTRAEFASSRNFPVQGFNDESHAFRHYVWAGLLTKELGAEKAQVYLDAHEANPLQLSAERAMDLANNRGGILGAQKLIKRGAFDLKQLERAALDDLKNDRLVILNPGLTVPKESL